MKLVLVILAALWACGERSPPAAYFGAPPGDGSGTAAAPGGPATAASHAPAAPARTKQLVETGRWAKAAVPVAFAHDPRQWAGAIDHAVSVHDGDREVARLPARIGQDGPLAALPGGGWVAGGDRLAADGTVVWSAYAWGEQFGRFGGPKAMALTPDGLVAIVAASDSPSTCLRDRGCGRSPGSSAGALARFTWSATDPTAPPVERRLADHPERRDYHVAASARWLAALDSLDLSVWPVAGDAAPTTVTLPVPSFSSIAWAGDRYLVGLRWVDAERTELVVLDRAAGFARTAAFTIDGTVHAWAVRPGGTEVAVALSHYRARATVEIDERKVAIYALTGALRASADLAGHPIALAWSPRGDALLVSTGGEPADQATVRFAIR